MPTPEENSNRVDRLFADYLELVDHSLPVQDFVQQHASRCDELRELISTHDVLVELTSELEEAPTIQYTAGARRESAAGYPQHIGKYRIIHEIAAGGMGRVFRAHQEGLDRDVALKVVKAGDLASDEDVRRFRAEAEAAAKLKHPNIVRIHDVDEYEGRPFFSMELVEGGGLDARLRNGPLPPREAAALVRTISLAVQYAHDEGVIHRDLKPGNVLIDHRGEPKVTDFGLAKRMDARLPQTHSDTVLGTPSYMSPEQALGASHVGSFSDIYSLGALLYHLLTGRPPFQAATATGTLLQVLFNEPVSPRNLNAAVDKDVETICLKCLEKESGDRYVSARELATDLDRFLKHEPIHARPVSVAERGWRWCRRHPIAAQCIATVVILLVFVTFASLRVADHREERLVDEVQRHNRAAAKWVATLVSMEIDEWRQPVSKAALLLRRHASQLKRINQDLGTPDSIRQEIESHEELSMFCRTWRERKGASPAIFNTWYVFSRDGTLVSLSRKEQKGIDPIGRQYSGRDYFKGAITKRGHTHVSRVFLSENDELFKYAISVAILDEKGEIVGVVAASIDAGPTLGRHKLSNDRQQVVVVGRGDRIPARRGAPVQKHVYPILVHPNYRDGQEPDEFTISSLWGSQPPMQDDHYVDPENSSGGRWLAAFHAVDGTEFQVIVQQKYDDAIPRGLSLDSNPSFWIVVSVVFASLLVGVSVVTWKQRNSAAFTGELEYDKNRDAGPSLSNK